MLKYEAKLIDPTPEQIVVTLAAATDGANKRCRTRLLEIDPAKVKKFLKRCEADAEGWEMFRGGRGGVPASQVLAAWWTDAARRKHVVVRGRRVEHRESARLLHKEELDQRPPLFHAYPEYVCRRTTRAGSEVVCACGCGVVGTPQTLGWMGECCGPCSDRRDEVGPEGLRANIPGVLYGDREPLTAVACSPDGNLVAAVEEPKLFHLWNLRDRERTTGGLAATALHNLCFTTNGRFLLLAGFGLLSGSLTVFDTTVTPPARVTLPEGVNALRVTHAPAPESACLHGYDATRSRLSLVRLPSGEVTDGVPTPGGFMGPMAASRDGRRVALTDERVSVRDARTLAEEARFTVGSSIRSLAFSHDAVTLYVGTMEGTVVRYDVGSGQRLATGILGKTVLERDYSPSLAVDPNGEAVYAAGTRGRLHVLHPETLDTRVTFDWHLGAVSGLAVSADGSRLFSAGGDGCVKVWPVRELLRGA